MPTPVTLYEGGKPHATAKKAEEAAQKAGAPETGYGSYERVDGSHIPVVLLREDQFWMREHVNALGAVAYPAWVDLPLPRCTEPKWK